MFDERFSQQTLNSTPDKIAAMNADLASLHKILKDPTRQKIISLLNEKGSLTYTDLLNAAGAISTGTLNYHLKILGDLLEKTEAGQYTLSEKGKLASRLLVEFPQPDFSLQAKKTWWRRFWFAAVILDAAAFLLVAALYATGYLDSLAVVRAFFGLIFSLAFLYFFYRMIRPVNKTLNPTQPQSQSSSNRTVKDILVFGRTMQEVALQVQIWVKQEGIVVEAQSEGFVRGRLGIPSGLGLTAPKYFEVTFKPEQDGVRVHTEGWISVYDVSERSFTDNLLAYGNIPRRKGWKVMMHLWDRLNEISTKQNKE